MASMMQSYLSTNYLEGKKKYILSPEEGATATLEQGVTDIQSPAYTPAVTSAATPMPLPGGVSPIQTSTASPLKVPQTKAITVMSTSAALEAEAEHKGLVAEVADDEKRKKRNRLLMGVAAAGGLYLLLTQ